MDNPFELFNYRGPDYFCDREDDLELLNEAFQNRRNLVLFSDRRLGKSHLIHHFHHHLETQKNVITIYLDVLNTRSDEDFINAFVSAVTRKFSEEESKLSKIIKTFQRFQPSIKIDAITGNPELKLEIKDGSDVSASMTGVMELLEESRQTIQIAIDEFQVIETYKNGSLIDATLRSHLISSPKLHLLFSGSETHLLAGLFSTQKKPLFGSTAQMTIHKIGYAPYFEFIKKHFEENEKTIRDQHIHEILTWSETYTFYTHFLCNQVFGNTNKEVDPYILNKSKLQCLKQFEVSFLQLENILPKNQWNLLVAVAKEGQVDQITKQSFLSKYGFSGSSALQSVEALQSKHLLFEKLDNNENYYYTNDIFFKRWVEQFR
ncbi:ATP-binding protein [Portibacter marinus]|uniref:ATP-binding protein n=1 Tax=Portibacter marinus TaxID=2898660 RepID=UPI001F2EE5CC|nr:ATP-binding protein [Portibacter marinus]